MFHLKGGKHWGSRFPLNSDNILPGCTVLRRGIQESFKKKVKCRCWSFMVTECNWIFLELLVPSIRNTRPGLRLQSLSPASGNDVMGRNLPRIGKLNFIPSFVIQCYNATSCLCILMKMISVCVPQAVFLQVSSVSVYGLVTEWTLYT
jgi:hypothetical protein